MPMGDSSQLEKESLLLRQSGQGRESAKTFLAANPEIAASIEQAIRANAGQIGQNLVLNTSEAAEAEED